MNKPVIAASNEHSGRLESAPPLEPVQAHGVLKSPAQPSVLADDAAEDSVWVERALNKDNDAFESLFNKYRQRVFSVAWRLLRDEDAALDVVQDAFVKAYEQLEKLRGDSRFFPWIRRIAINLSIDRLRHIRRGVEVSLDESRVGGGDESHEEPAGVVLAKSGSESPLHRAEMSEFGAAFTKAVARLSEPHRAVFMLHAAEGLSYKEIAEELQCSMGTVMSRLFYARKRLQELLGAHLQ